MRDIRNVMTKEKIKHHLANEMYGYRIYKEIYRGLAYSTNMNGIYAYNFYRRNSSLICNKIDILGMKIIMNINNNNKLHS
jgi:hypothetical protein